MNALLSELEAYVPDDEREAEDRDVMIDFLKTGRNCFSRENRLAHFTATAWIVNRERTKVLMVFHNIYHSWSWVGGHADGEEDLLKVVRKEIEEETGLSSFRLLSDGIYGVNIIPVESHIKKGKRVSSHLHLDVEFLFEADENELIRIKEDENSNIGWIRIDEVNEKVSEENMKPIYERMNRKLYGY